MSKTYREVPHKERDPITEREQHEWHKRRREIETALMLDEEADEYQELPPYFQP